MKRIKGLAMTALVTASLGVASIGTANAEQSDNSGSATTHSKDCSKLAVVMSGGGQSLQSVPHGKIPSATNIVAENLQKSGYTVSTPEYDAAPFVYNRYEQSVDKGITIAEKSIAKITEGCDNPQVTLVGYSESADIMSQVVNKISQGKSTISEDEFSSALLVANPRHGSDNTYRIGNGGDSDNGILDNLDKRGGYGDIADRVVEVCDDADYICSDDAGKDVKFLRDPLMKMGIATGQLPTGIIKELSNINPSQYPELISKLAKGANGHTSYGAFFSRAHKSIISTNDRVAKEKKEHTDLKSKSQSNSKTGSKSETIYFK